VAAVVNLALDLPRHRVRRATRQAELRSFLYAPNVRERFKIHHDSNYRLDVRQAAIVSAKYRDCFIHSKWSLKRTRRFVDETHSRFVKGIVNVEFIGAMIREILFPCAIKNNTSFVEF